MGRTCIHMSTHSFLVADRARFRLPRPGCEPRLAWRSLVQDIIDPRCRMDLAQDVSDLASKLRIVLGKLVAHSDADTYRTSVESGRRFLEALGNDFDVGGQIGRPALGKTARQLSQSVTYQKKRRTEAEKALQEAVASKTSGRIAHLWFVRVGLADPCVPATTLERFLSRFPGGREENTYQTST